MYRTALRSASRPVVHNLRNTAVRAAPRRFASTATPADKPRTWKGSALRLGLAFAAVYYYNTSPVFADEATAQTIPPPAAFSQDDLPTVDSVLEQKRKQIQARPEPVEKTPAQETAPDAQTAAVEGSPAALEEEAGQQGAFNPETGEINWDCPCLGGMAHGPCGEEFKTAFSCFVYSTEEPKGMDCIEKFQGMQECFKQYPEIYGAELADDEDEAAPETEGAVPAADAQKVAAELPAEEKKDDRVVISPKKAEDATDANNVNPEEKQLVSDNKEVKAEPTIKEKAEKKAEEVKSKVEEKVEQVKNKIGELKA